MSKFNVGDWVITKDIGGRDNVMDVAKVVSMFEDKRFYVKFLEPKNYDYEGEFLFSETSLRICTVLDYIRTFDGEQIAMFVEFVNTKQKLCQLRCDVCATVNSADRIACFLRQPLTDDIIKQLGGENNG